MGFSSIRFSINGREFYAEGDAAEVTRKLHEFMGEAFSPLRKAVNKHFGVPWRQILGIRAQHPTVRLVEQRFRVLARKHHPDKGGDRKKFEEIVRAREAARLELAS